MTEAEKESWHLDKRVPITLILAICMQTLSALWWAASMNYKVESYERRLENLETITKETGTQYTAIIERMARLEEKSQQQLEIARRLETQITSARPR